MRVDREPVAPVALDAAMLRPDTIAGIVTDEDGAPVAGAWIVVTGHEGDVSTDDAGRFWFAREPEDSRTVAIRGVAEHWDRGDHEDLVATRWVPWGTHGLRFVLRRKVAVQIDLVDVDETLHGTTMTSKEEYERDLRDAGFADVRLIDMTDEWGTFCAGRAAGWQGSRDRHVRVHGEDTYARLERFFVTVTRLFANGGLGGVRIVARR